MKVLLYAVFKERGVDSPSAGDRITKDERVATLGDRSLKAKQCSPENTAPFCPPASSRPELMVARPLRTGRSSRRAKIRSISMVTFSYESRATDAEKTSGSLFSSSP
jgi:hypothetical protein